MGARDTPARLADDPGGTACEDALVALGEWLRQQGYTFVTPTPATHARVLRRPAQGASSLHDAFGWSRPFGADLLPRPLHDVLAAAGLIDVAGGSWRSRVRFSSLADLLLSHSAFPTEHEDAVFFGPDTSRFARQIAAELALRPLSARPRVLDVGCGSGAGGLLAARAGRAARLVLADINPHALEHARANARLAGQQATFVQGDLYAPVAGEFDLIVSNPPYLVDDRQRTYRNGGGPLGGGLSQRIVAEGLERLAPGGRLLLYTGAAIVHGHDAMREAVGALAHARGWPWHYEELDPDVFGEELDTPAYAHCDRIAAVGAVIERPDG
ncbi:MAG: class I SAM-dependent methyltransferase [Burkholderiales bacterium]|jgi:SAM-dependent methyltransferase|nr:class I SAM-dependent methyltransferase [Burkholderiales bacterium]